MWRRPSPSSARYGRSPRARDAGAGSSAASRRATSTPKTADARNVAAVSSTVAAAPNSASAKPDAAAPSTWPVWPPATVNALRRNICAGDAPRPIAARQHNTCNSLPRATQKPTP